ncbi:hypothetical protein CDD80_7344 [Ophiocordyceps camponoti-rufipedis]|uniref:Uncharacterized protein n=1 Tax=Ophiocordyceps camponoti-rufipedis TaxID=2004952 RepID=A0A2C5YNU3_9HYPO|nr:hypothetical protein CDD80_7344 [Ophiocordyceps camponoti-rufipedis]
MVHCPVVGAPARCAPWPIISRGEKELLMSFIKEYPGSLFSTTELIVMDYHAVHGHDISSFDLRGTHRLPTVAASQALDELQDQPLPTGLDRLDRALAAPEVLRGGFRRGQVTEIWGPPGSGKTALAIQVAAHAICSGHDVAWVDCFQRVNEERITRVVEHVERSRPRDEDGGPAQARGRFSLLSCLTLPHLMAVVSQPTPRLIGAGVSLIVISALSALLNSALPKSHDAGARSKATVAKGLSAPEKRLKGLQFVMSALEKLAATRKCAVVILSQCATKMQSEQGATLVTAVNTSVWDQGVMTRLVLFRDWAWRGAKLCSVLMAGLQRLDGQATSEGVEPVSTFSVGAGGVLEIDPQVPPGGPSAAGRKRKLGQTELEVPDSEDDDDDNDRAYGWASEDEAAMPAPPPQWQGSEDILLGHSGSSDGATGESPR